MNKHFQRAFRLCQFSYIFLCVLILPIGLTSCGGGSSGSGVLPITGIARTIAGEPIVGLLIDVETANSNDQAVTNENGEVNLEAVLDETNAVLFQFRSDTIRAEEILGDIPEDAIAVRVEWDFGGEDVLTLVTYFFENQEPLILEF